MSGSAKRMPSSGSLAKERAKSYLPWALEAWNRGINQWRRPLRIRAGEGLDRGALAERLGLDG